MHYNLVLGEQWVTSHQFPDEMWRVRRRRGMGRLHVKGLADLAYYNRAAKGCAACPVTVDAYGLLNICRLRDDVLV